MNSLIESLNAWGGRFMEFALPMLWQSSVLMVLVFAFDVLLRRKIRPAVRYTLWFVVFVKLLLPPSLALPTGPAWWLRAHDAPAPTLYPRAMRVTYQGPSTEFVLRPAAPRVSIPPPPPVRLSRDAGFLLASLSISALLGAWALFRWWQVARCVRRTTAATGELCEMLAEVRRLARLRKNVRLQLTSNSMSPAVCGLFRPVVLLPESLIGKLTAHQLRAVLLHELIHLKRRDVWVNCAQTLLQIAYWWHPLLWFANARVRRVREEAVDDAVMYALNEEAEIYAPTLLEVAKLAFNRPLATLGLVGILESRNALRHRIERLLNFSAPRRVGISVMSVIGIAAFTALAVPMGEPPARPSPSDGISDPANLMPYRAKVDPDVFVHNLQARAAETMHTTNDNLVDILTSILDGFGVDCSPPRNIAFNAVTGEITVQNTSEALQVVDEVVKELNLPGGERILNPPFGLKQVLIEAQFYILPPDVLKSTRGFEFPPEGILAGWEETSQPSLTRKRDLLRQKGIKPISSPRIQTSHGITASLFVGDDTNNIQLECVPYVHDGQINLTVLARTSGKYVPNGKGWPDLSGHTNCAIFSRLSIPEGNSVGLFAPRGGYTDQDSLFVLLKASIVEPKEQSAIPIEAQEARPVAASDSSDATNLPSFIFHFDRNTVAQLLAKFAAEHKLADTTNSALLMQKFLENAGVDLQPPKSFFYGASDGFLAMRAKTEDLQKTAVVLGLNVNAGQLLADGKSLYEMGKLDEAGAKLRQVLNVEPDNQAALYYSSLVQQAKARSTADERNIHSNNRGPVPNPYTHTNTIHTSAARQKIYDKLTNIKFEKISFPNLPLSEVVRNLTEWTRQRDADLQGINFLLNRAVPRAGTNGQPPAFDPTTGPPIATSSASEDTDLRTVTISLDPVLTNVRLLDVLEAIVKSSDHPIKYSILDYGIEFSLKGAEIPELHTRTFKVDPNTFFMNLQNVGFLPAVTNASITGSGQNRYVQAVTKIDPAAQLQPIIHFFNSIGVNLAAPKSVFFNERQGTLTVHATDDDLELIEQAINTLNLAPPEVTIKVRFVEVDPEFFTTIFTNSTVTGTNIARTGVLTESQFKPVLNALQKKDHATLIGEGAVTTLSGRQAQFQTVDVKTVVNGLNATVTNRQTSYSYKTTEMPFGSMLDVVATVAPDGYTIQMNVTPSVTEFLGYEDPKDYVKYDEKLKNATLPLPKYRSRQVTTSALVWDGQTLVLGNLSDESVVAEPNGTKLRQPYNGNKKQLIIFITPTITDPSGNLVHAGNGIHSKDYYDDMLVR